MRQAHSKFRPAVSVGRKDQPTGQAKGAGAVTFGRLARPVITAAVAGLLLLASTGSSAALTLSEALSEALPRHPSVQQARAELNRAATQIDLSRDEYLPSFALSARSGSRDRSDRVGLGVTATQTLYDWGRVSSLIDKATAAQRQSVMELRRAGEEAALEVGTSYLDALAAARRLAIARTQMAFVEEVADMLLARSLAGYGTRSEIARAKLDYAMAQEDLVAARSAESRARAELRDATGQQATRLSIPGIPSVFGLLLQQAELTAAVRKAPAHSAAKADVSIAEAELRRHQAEMRPAINLVGDLRADHSNGSLSPDGSIGIELKMTLSGGKLRRGGTAARQDIETARWKMRATERDLQREFLNLADSHQADTDRLVVLREQIDRTDELRGLYLEQFSGGQRDVLELLSMSQKHYEARQEMARTETQILRARLAAAALLGRLGEAILATGSLETVSQQ